jgi:hypothetical protein
MGRRYDPDLMILGRGRRNPARLPKKRCSGRRIMACIANQRAAMRLQYSRNMPPARRDGSLNGGDLLDWGLPRRVSAEQE